MTVCRYYLQGTCRFGDRCRFEHPDPHGSDGYDYSKRRNDYSYQDRPRPNQIQARYVPDPRSNQTYGNNQNRYYSNQRQDQNQRYVSERNQVHYESSQAYNPRPDHRETSYNQSYSQTHGKNYVWMSDQYKKQLGHKAGEQTFFNSGTPKSHTTFSFKDPDISSKKQHPTDLHMNETNLIYAGIIREDAITWEMGNYWPFSCYFPIQGKPGFPGFNDLSPEELRFEAYKAIESNTYNSYVESVKDVLTDIKRKRDQLKEPSIQLMSIIEKISQGESLSPECSVDGFTSLSKPNQTTVEDMAADESVLPTPVSTFSFKTTLEGDTTRMSSASSFSFKLPVESEANKASMQVDNEEIYTSLEKLLDADKEQFMASTFTLGKIPTVPPPQQMCF